jgi:hypothetical protein
MIELIGLALLALAGIIYTIKTDMNVKYENVKRKLDMEV